MILRENSTNVLLNRVISEMHIMVRSGLRACEVRRVYDDYIAEGPKECVLAHCQGLDKPIVSKVHVLTS